MQEQIQV